ncbi:MAG: helicase-associated domain-containing protein [Spirochaetes bacterium]|nr:helicase-associated domain-containing protein [Spirochaetota bacterium]
MKEIRKAIHSLSEENRNALTARLQLKSRSETVLVSSLTSYTGLHDILTTLDPQDLAVFRAVYKAGDGITLGDLEKELKLKIPDIARSADALTRLCLVYIMKNRQLINNKLDKVYCISEIAGLLKIESDDALREHSASLSEILRRHSESAKPSKESMEEEDRRILSCIAQNGFFAPIYTVKGQSTDKNFEASIRRLIEGGRIRILHLFSPTFQTVFAIDRQAAVSSLVFLKGSSGTATAVRNRYFFLNNLLMVYDTVTTYGLFLTKQLEFRKIDIKRICDSIITLVSTQGQPVNREKIAYLLLYVLNKLGSLKLRKDIAHLSFTDLQKELDNPARFLARVLRVIRNAEPDNPFFPSPFDIPSPDTIATVTGMFEQTDPVNPQRCALIYHLTALAESGSKETAGMIASYRANIEQVKQTIHLLCLTGILDVRGGMYTLSDIGQEVMSIRAKGARDAESAVQGKSVYINPDFTIIIPMEEIDSKSLYHLLSYVQILKHDVIMHVQITKESIVKSRKRGMLLKRFTETLAFHAKNEIPQNMKFLVNEWSRQTIDINISNAILIKTTHPTFIDELEVGKLKHCLIDRISDTCAIIQKDCIDDIVKIGRKKDAVITLFADDDSED